MSRTPVSHEFRMEKTSKLYLIPAITVSVLMRREIGTRILNLTWIVPTAAALYLIQPLSGRSLDDHSLRTFAVVFLIAAFLHLAYYAAVRASGRPVWHSLSRGRSWLSFLPLPETVVHLLVDPALCVFIGWKVSASGYSVWLGSWLMIAAGCLFLTELTDFRHNYHRAHDLIDGEIEGRRQGDAIRTRRAGGAASADAPRATVVTGQPRRPALWSWHWRA